MSLGAPGVIFPRSPAVYPPITALVRTCLKQSRYQKIDLPGYNLFFIAVNNVAITFTNKRNGPIANGYRLGL